MCNSVLFKSYFKSKRITQFYKQQFYYLFAAAAVTTVSYMLCRNLDSIILRGAISVTLPPVMLLVLYLPCSRWKSSMAIVRRIMKFR